MLRFPDFDPVALQIGPVAVHWYGLAYLGGFACAWWLGRQRARQAWRGWAPEQVDDLVFYCALGVIFGGRIGYALFYDLAEVIASPLRILRIWEGGMSFHGGLLGVLAAGALFGRKQGKGFFAVGDFVAPLVPLGLAFGRLGNFVNGELWGRVSDLPWAMVFPDPRAGDLARHPTQLYQAALEGLTLFVILWLFTRRERPAMAASGVFLLGYGAFRFLVELVRMPDAHIGYLSGGWLTLGQTLTMPMLAVGVGLLVLAYRRRADATAAGGGGVSR